MKTEGKASGEDRSLSGRFARFVYRWRWGLTAAVVLVGLGLFVAGANRVAGFSGAVAGHGKDPLPKPDTLGAYLVLDDLGPKLFKLLPSFNPVYFAILNFALPSYAAGVIGGLTALPIWEFLKRIRSKN